MDEDLLKVYCRSAYRVRLPRGGTATWATIHIGKPLPVALRPLAEDRDWGFITAWNPRSQPRPAADNRKQQRRLLADLRADAALVIHPALGLADAWKEPSLWIVGIAPDALERLGVRYAQNAWLQGHGAAPARLCLHP